MTRFREPLVGWPQATHEDMAPGQEGGHAPLHCLVAEHDFAEEGGAIGDIGLDAYVPDNAIIVGGFVEVLTTYTSATDAATIALKTEGAGDIVAAVAISDAGNPWDAGNQTIIPDFATPGDFVKMSAKREVTATVAVEALTAGKMRVYLFYVPSV